FTLEVTDADADADAGAASGGGAGEVHAVGLENAALHHSAGGPHPDAEATVRTTHAGLVAAITAGRLDHLADPATEAGAVSSVEGRVEVLAELSDLLDDFELFFPIVTP